jgi:hypothetical protein
MGYRLGEFLYINIFTNDFVEPERYVVVKCSISSGDCEMIANNGNTYQYGYLEDSNMLAFGWQERDSLIDVSTEDRINTFTGKTYPKGYGIE